MRITVSITARKIAVFGGMVIAIAIIGIIFGFLAALIGSQILGDEVGGFGGLVGALAGMVIGYPIGVVIGIFFINKVLHYRGSILMGIIGAVLGGVLPVALAEPLGLNNNPDLLWALILLLPSLSGATGFHLGRALRGG
jgi:hypothetical protein